MIQTDNDVVQLICDTCGSESPTFERDDFDRMIESAKSDGWKITRDAGEWSHRCCETGAALAAARRKFGLR